MRVSFAGNQSCVTKYCLFRFFCFASKTVGFAHWEPTPGFPAVAKGVVSKHLQMMRSHRISYNLIKSPIFGLQDHSSLELNVIHEMKYQTSSKHIQTNINQKPTILAQFVTSDTSCNIPKIHPYVFHHGRINPWLPRGNATCSGLPRPEVAPPGSCPPHHSCSQPDSHLII